MPEKTPRKLLPLIILAIGIGGFALLKLTRPEPETVSAQERSWLVEVTEIAPGEHTPVLSLYGEVVAPDQQRITAPVAGRIDERPVREGQRVREGDLLVALDQADIQPLVKQAEADVSDLMAQIASEKVRHRNDQQALEGEKAILDNARRQFERTQSLVGRKLASQEALDAAADALARARLTVTARQRAIAEHPSRLNSLQARLDRAQAALSSISLDAQRARVTAPFDGIVTGVEVATGDRVNKHANLLSIYPDQGLELRATVPDRYRAELLKALDDGKALTAVSADERYRFTLDRFAGTSSPSGTEAILMLNGKDDGLRPGGLLPVTLQRPSVSDSVAIPYSALYGSASVYRMTSEGRMERIHVQRLGEVAGSDTNDESGRQVLVASPDLKSGQSLIVTHLPNAMSGLKVQRADAENGAAE